MIGLIWGILNLILILSFFYFALGLLFKGRKWLHQYDRRLTYPVLFIGFLSIAAQGKRSKKEINSHLKFPVSMETTKVKNDLVSNFHITLIREKESSKLLLNESSTNLLGFIAGREWVHLGFSLEGNQIIAYGMMNWKLFGGKVYSNSVSFLIPEEEKVISERF